ncbi:hypothetical protein NC653_000734 [Populus alba x Populus x berolinensis]|uniref:Uncharacterized protein n=1 Tax=Populus alba x Populus x berolinensis TaxID=444605 RepID=A0AAD6RL65_9ROSI|nr:hypothetical protein NC653_000734 [Populus alba x Populus x berolinensis]
MPQNTCFSYSICTYHTASCFASLYKIKQHSTVGRDYANQTIPGRTQAVQTRSSHHKINHKLIFHDKVQGFKLYIAGCIEQAGFLSYEQGVSEAPNSGSFCGPLYQNAI